MKKDNKLVNFTTLVLLITIVAISLVSGTYAKYTSTVSGTDTAIVARWNVSAGTVETSVDIFGESKIYDTKGVTDYTAAGIADADVKTAEEGNNGIIAPGTWGKFSYVLTNNSDVNATYAITYTVDEAGVPLEWSINGTDWTDSLENVDATAIAMEGEKQVDLYWRWEFDGDHTALGEAETLATPLIKISVTFEQAD